MGYFSGGCSWHIGRSSQPMEINVTAGQATFISLQPEFVGYA
jgi:hypothetical protein